MAKNVQKMDNVTRLIRAMDSQNKMGINWPIQKMVTLIKYGTLT